MTEQTFAEPGLQQALFRVRLWVALNEDEEDEDDKDDNEDATPEQRQHLALCEWFVNQPDTTIDSHTPRPRKPNETGLSWKQVSDWMGNTRRRFTARRKAGVHPQTALEYKLDRMCNSL